MPTKPKRSFASMQKELEPAKTVVYKTVGHRKLTLHLFYPPGFKPTDQRPVFVAIHGGGWRNGTPRRFYPYAHALVPRGFVGISVEYRLVTDRKGNTVFDCVKDGRSAIRYIRAHAKDLGIDPNRITVAGGSAGGHVAAGTALFGGIDDPNDDLSVSCVPDAVVLLFAVLDTSPTGYGNKLIGANWKSISPVDQITPGCPPTLIFHGDKDTVTTTAVARKYQEVMRKKGNVCELVVEPSGAHGYLNQNMQLFDQAIDKIEAFLDEQGLGMRKNKTAEGEGKFIDIHIHANAWSDNGFNLEAVTRWMKQKDVKRCIVQYQVEPPRNEAERQHSVENYRKYPGKIYWFCRIDPQDVTNKAQAVAILREMKRQGAIGFGEYYGKGLYFDDPNSVRLYEACGEVGLPVLFHMDGGNNKDEAGLGRLEKVVKSHPKCTFIGHGPGWWANIRHPAHGKADEKDAKRCVLDRLLETYPNLYGDLSAGSGARAIGGDREFGKAFLIRNADKLMFGTDIGPWSGDAAQFSLFDSMNLPTDVTARIYRDNAEKLFAFDKHDASEAASR